MSWVTKVTVRSHCGGKGLSAALATRVRGSVYSREAEMLVFPSADLVRIEVTLLERRHVRVGRSSGRTGCGKGEEGQGSEEKGDGAQEHHRGQKIGLVM